MTRTRRHLLALGLSVGIGTALFAPPATAAAVLPAMKITASSVAGPEAGAVTIKWSQVATKYRTHTTGFRIETSLVQFSPYKSGLPRHGRGWHAFTAKSTARSLKLSASSLASAHAPLASGDFLYYRVWAIDKTAAGTKEQTDGKLRVARVLGQGATGDTPLTVASFNVRQANLDAPGSGRGWVSRLPLVADRVVASGASVVTLQELSPTQYDGRYGTADYYPAARQTDSLTKALARAGHSEYRLTRSTPFSTKPGTQQGQRILYDSSRLTMLSPCTDHSTGAHPDVSASCSAELPLASGDTQGRTRWFTFAHFQDKATGKTFWVVSTHLDERYAGLSAANQTRFEKLRATQASAVLSWIAKNVGTEPVVLGADINTWQNNKVASGYLAHDTFVRGGMYDASAAASVSGLEYSTVNNFGTNGARLVNNYGPRYDMIATKNMGQGSDSFAVMPGTIGGVWPSDHNMVVAHLRLP